MDGFNEEEYLRIAKKNVKIRTIDKNTIGVAIDNNIKGVGINPKVKLNQNQIKLIAYHEIGHQLIGIKAISYQITDLFKKQKKNIINEISQRAAINEYEFAAEAWAQYKTSKYPSKLAMQVAKIVIEERNALYGKKYGNIGVKKNE